MSAYQCYYIYDTAESKSMQIQLINVQTTLTRLSATIERFARVYNQRNQRIDSQNMRNELYQALVEEQQVLTSVHSEVDALNRYSDKSISPYQQWVKSYFCQYYNAARGVFVQHSALYVEVCTSGAWYPQIH